MQNEQKKKILIGTILSTGLVATACSLTAVSCGKQDPTPPEPTVGFIDGKSSINFTLGTPSTETYIAFGGLYDDVVWNVNVQNGTQGTDYKVSIAAGIVTIASGSPITVDQTIEILASSVKDNSNGSKDVSAIKPIPREKFTFNSNDTVLMGLKDDAKDLSAYDTLKIPKGVTEVSESAFKDKFGGEGQLNPTITNLIITEGVKTIKANAFMSCVGLKCGLVIPSSVTVAEKYAFATSGFTSLTVLSNAINLADEFIYECSYITKIVCNFTTFEHSNFNNSSFNIGMDVSENGTVKNNDPSGNITSNMLLDELVKHRLPNTWEPIE